MISSMHFWNSKD